MVKLQCLKTYFKKIYTQIHKRHNKCLSLSSKLTIPLSAAKSDCNLMALCEKLISVACLQKVKDTRGVSH
jgi:hypothetical protein